MTEPETRETIQSLRAILGASSLEWISREVDETLRLGKPILRKIIASGEQDPDVVIVSVPTSLKRTQERAERRKTTIPTTEEYSPSEELALLLSAIQRTVVAVREMELHLLQTMGKPSLPTDGVRQIQFERYGNLSDPIQSLDPATDQRVIELQGALKALKKRAE